MIVKHLEVYTIAEYLAAGEEIQNQFAWVKEGGYLIPIQQINVVGDTAYILLFNDDMDSFGIKQIVCPINAANRGIYVDPIKRHEKVQP